MRELPRHILSAAALYVAREKRGSVIIMTMTKAISSVLLLLCGIGCIVMGLVATTVVAVASATTTTDIAAVTTPYQNLTIFENGSAIVFLPNGSKPLHFSHEYTPQNNFTYQDGIIYNPSGMPLIG